MSTYNFIIASSILQCSTDFLNIVSPYYDDKKPIITVYASGDYSNFEQSQNTLKAVIKTAACAFPTGIPTPTSASGLILDYYNNNKSLYYTNVDYLNGTLTKINKDINGVMISGNCYYNIYATNILTISENGKEQILGYGDLVSSVFYLTRAPYPKFGEGDDTITLGVEDNGETVNNTNLVSFTFNTNELLNNFANLDKFGAGYPDIAESGLLRISCSGIASGVYFPSLYDGSNESTTPIYEYMETIPSGIVFKIPKFVTTNTYADYIFNIEYINSSGIVTGPTNITYSSSQMTDFFTKQYNRNDTVIVNDKADYEIVTVEGVTNRSRLAIGVSDIDLISTQYNEKGVYISNTYTNEKPIYLISMETNEEIQSFSRFNTWDIVKYYIKIQGDNTWHRISPKPRVNEIDEQGNYVPSILILDNLLLNEDKINDVYNNIKFITYDKTKYNFNIKIEIDTNITGLRGQWTPSIYDYKISVVDRESILSSNYERYLFN